MDLSELLARASPLVRQGRDALRELEQLATTAYVSKITALPNGNALDLLAKEYDRQLDARVAVLFIDLTGFKDVNDSYDHLVGDAALRAVGDALLDLVRTHAAAPAQAFHKSGDEFIIVTPVAIAAEFAGTVAERISKNDVPVPLAGGGNVPGVRANVGYALPDALTTIEELTKRADIACQVSKFMATGDAVQWAEGLEKPKSTRRRCPNADCRATTSLSYLPSRKKESTFTKCASCHTPLGAPT